MICFSVIRLRASDGDGDEITFYFSNTTYTHTQGMFWLDDETGVISLRKPVDAENTSLSGPYVFEV